MEIENESSCQERPESSGFEASTLDAWMSYLGHARWDDDAAFEELCKQRSDLAPDLRRLRSGWKGHENSLGATTKPSLSERLQSLAKPLSRDTRFRREGEIGRGGMGVIHRVRDLELDRPLALKEMIVGPAEKHPTKASRFLEEAQITSQLDHPGIVPVHEVGMDAQGRLYFAMKLVRGRDLRTILDLLHAGREGWNLTRALGVLLKVCEAVAYAHSKGVIHRDLKPGNVMVGNYGEAYVMDWGLARALGREDTHDIRLKREDDSISVHTSRRSAREETPDSPLVTMDGDVVGTPSYMSPEQACGDVHFLSPRSDVYSVGAMLYHMLTGQAPFVRKGVRKSSHAILAQLLDGPPTAVLELNPQAPTELVAICEKAMARDPEARYPGTLEVGRDLAAFVEGRVVAAYQSGSWAETKKWVQRNKALAVSLATAGVLLVAGLALSLVAHTRADEVLRLSALQRLEELTREAQSLWPAHPQNIPRYEAWLTRAAALVAELPDHEHRLSALRARARPWTPEDQSLYLATSPEAKENEGLRRELDFLVARRSAREATGPVGDPSPDEAGVDFARLPSDPTWLNALAWPLVGPDRTEFGREAKGLLLARRMVELESKAEWRDTLAWALFALGRFEEALAEEERALEVALPAQELEFEGHYQRLLEAIEQERGPAASAKARERIAVLEASTQHWKFDDDEDQWWHNQLEKLVDRLQAFSDERTGLFAAEVSEEYGWSIPKRLASALALRDGFAPHGEHSRAWMAALPEIHRAYPGLVLKPQLGLVPIGPDPDSGLWEFAHLETGAPAERGVDGKLRLTESSGLVFVLLPEGTFRMGAQRSDPKGPNYDPYAEDDEGAVHLVTLSAFFFSKYEMTQGQWQRFGGHNPSKYGPETTMGGRQTSLLHPVEQVTWNDCVRAMERLGLSLPSEAQWEYATRAGTTSIWSTGADRKSVKGAGNLADSYCKNHYGPQGWSYEEWLDDGYSVHAPVGSYAANGFGLHDMLGNVEEWCLDGNYSLPHPPDPTRDPLVDPAIFPNRVNRGGGWSALAVAARSAFRYTGVPLDSGYDLGLRPARAIEP